MVFILFSCNNNQFNADLSDSNINLQNKSKNTIIVNKGEEFEIVLDDNTIKGFKWEIVNNFDNEIVLPLSKKLERIDPNVSDTNAKSIWTFKALKNGKSKVTLQYTTNWLKKNQPIKTETFEIHVNDPVVNEYSLKNIIRKYFTE